MKKVEIVDTETGEVTDAQPVNERPTGTEIAVQRPAGTSAVASYEPMTVDELVQRVKLVQEVSAKVMKEGLHYGAIPGAGDKKVLLKPGAEILGLTFRLRPEYVVSEVGIGPAPGGARHVKIQVTCNLFNINTGALWGSGVASCSTMESKYRYRSIDEPTTAEVPRSYWDQRKEGADGKTLQNILRIASGGSYPADAKFGTVKDTGSGKWFVSVKSKGENPDIADVYNTVLKMCAKRAHASAIITATAASDTYTMDVDDFQPDPEPTRQEPAKPATAAAPTQQAQPAKPPAPPATQEPDEDENAPEAKRIATLQRRIWGVARDLSIQGTGHDNGQRTCSCLVATGDDIWKAIQDAGAALHEPNPSQARRYVIMSEQTISVLEKLAAKLTAVRSERLKPKGSEEVRTEEVFPAAQ